MANALLEDFDFFRIVMLLLYAKRIFEVWDAASDFVCSLNCSTSTMLRSVVTIWSDLSLYWLSIAWQLQFLTWTLYALRTVTFFYDQPMTTSYFQHTTIKPTMSTISLGKACLTFGKLQICRPFYPWCGMCEMCDPYFPICISRLSTPALSSCYGEAALWLLSFLRVNIQDKINNTLLVVVKLIPKESTAGRN